MDKSRIIEKIKKCLARRRSANEHEAAAALRQAQALSRVNPHSCMTALAPARSAK